jgi:hypothetical protein
MPIEISKPGINVREQLNALRTPVSEAGSKVMRSDSTYDQVALLGLQPNNVFINGDQRIWQRGTTQTGLGSSNEVVVSDRWRNYQAGTSGRCTWERDSDAPDGHEYSAKLSVTTADTSVAADHRWNIAYRMESDDFTQFGFGTEYAVGFTIQFWVKTNKVGTYCIDAYKNGTAPTATRQFTIHQGGVWQQVVLTWPPSVYVASDPSFWIWLQAGSNYTADRGTGWATATDGRAHGISVNMYDSTSNYFKITGIQMTKGQVSSGLPFDRRLYGEELALCQRYYERFNGQSEWLIAHGYSVDIYATIDWKVPKRITGGQVTYSNSVFSNIITAYGNSGSSAAIDGVITGVVTASTAITGLSLNIDLSSGSYTPYGTSVMWRVDGGHWIAYDAEI